MLNYQRVPFFMVFHVNPTPSHGPNGHCNGAASITKLPAPGGLSATAPGTRSKWGICSWKIHRNGGYSIARYTCGPMYVCINMHGIGSWVRKWLFLAIYYWLTVVHIQVGIAVLLVCLEQNAQHLLTFQNFHGHVRPRSGKDQMNFRAALRQATTSTRSH